MPDDPDDVQIYVPAWSSQHRKEACEDNGHQSRYNDGKGTHGSFDLSHLHSFCGTDGMSRGSAHQPSCDRALDAEEFTHSDSNYISDNSGDNNDRNRNCYDTAQFLGYSHSDRCGDGLRKKGDIVRM